MYTGKKYALMQGLNFDEFQLLIKKFGDGNIYCIILKFADWFNDYIENLPNNKLICIYFSETDTSLGG